MTQRSEPRPGEAREESEAGAVGTRERAGIAALVAAALVLRIAFAWVLPVFQAPDEEAHFRYVAFLGEERTLPVQPERSLELFADPMHQAYQPPLAYASLAPASEEPGTRQHSARASTRNA